MRKRIISAMIALLMVGGCISKDNVPHLHLLSFQAINSLQTKNPSPLVSQTIGIYGNMTDSPGGTANSSCWGNSIFWTSDGDESTLYLKDACFARNNLGSYTGAEPSDPTISKPYYWPSSGSLIVAAYAPHSSQRREIQNISFQNHAEAKNQGLMKIDVQLNDKSWNEFDLLYADTKDINGGNTLEAQTRDVPVLLKHAQTRLTFNISKPTNYRIRMTLYNTLKKATFYSGKTPGWLPDFTVPVNYGTIVIADEITDPTASVEERISSSFVLIPMQLDGDYKTRGTLDPVRLEMEIIEDEQVAAGSQTITIPLLQYNTVWNGQKHYIYNITLNTQGIEFSAPIIENRDVEVAI